MHLQERAGFVLCCSIVGLMPGCASHKRLNDLSDPMVTLSIPEPPGTARVLVLARDASLQSRGPCSLPAAGAKAVLNGSPLERLRGKPKSGGDLMYDRDCFIEFAGDAGAIRKSGADASLRISDDTTSWDLEVPSAFAPRSFTLEPPSEGVVHRGQRVVLKWSPAEDPIDARNVGFELYRSGDTPGSGTKFRDIAVNGDELSFVISPGAGQQAWTGPAILRFLGGYQHPVPRHCPVHRCEVTVDVTVPPLALTLEN
jgi:hypothetical protein